MVEQVKDERNNKEFWFKWITGVLCFASLLYVIYLNSTDAENIRSGVFLFFISLGLFVVSMIGKSVYQQISKEDSTKELKVLSQPELFNLAEEFVLHQLRNHVRKGMSPIPRKDTINENVIYELETTLLYPQPINSKGSEGMYDKVYLYINATYPSLTPSVLPGSAWENQRRSEMNRMANNPKNEVFRESTVYDPYGRKTAETKEPINLQKEETKEETVA